MARLNKEERRIMLWKKQWRKDIWREESIVKVLMEYDVKGEYMSFAEAWWYVRSIEEEEEEVYGEEKWRKKGEVRSILIREINRRKEEDDRREKRGKQVYGFEWDRTMIRWIKEILSMEEEVGKVSIYDVMYRLETENKHERRYVRRFTYDAIKERREKGEYKRDKARGEMLEERWRKKWKEVEKEELRDIWDQEITEVTIDNEEEERMKRIGGMR